MKRTTGLVLVSLLALSVPAPAFGAPAAGEPGLAGRGKAEPVVHVDVKGSGCDKTSTVAVSPDTEAFTVIYSAYIVQVLGGAKPAKSKKICRITIHTGEVAGYQYALASVDYRGYAAVAAGATGVQRATYTMQGRPEKPFREHVVTGPPEGGDFQFTDDRIGESEREWSACGKERKIGIRTELEVFAGSSAAAEASTVALDSTDGSFSKYKLVWRKCTK